MSSGSGDWVKDLSVQFKCGDGWHQERLSDDTVEYIKAKLQEVDRAARIEEVSKIVAQSYRSDNPNAQMEYADNRLASLKGGDV